MGRREVGGRSAGAFGGTDGGLQWLWRARWRDRTRQEALADWAGASLRGRWVGWRVSGGRAPSGREWQGAQSGQGTIELGFPRPALWQMQCEVACRAGDPSGQGEEPPPWWSPPARPDRSVQRARLWGPVPPARRRWRRRPEGRWFNPTPCLRSRMAFSISAWRRWSASSSHLPVPVGDEAVIAVEEGPGNRAWASHAGR